MEIATRYPGISLEFLFGLTGAVFILVPLVLAGRRWPQTRTPAALFFGVALDVALDRFAGVIHQRRLDDRVLAAAGRGDAVSLRTALEDGGSPEADDPTSGGWPALGNSLDSGSTRTVELLLQRGADPSYGNLDQTSIEIARKAKRTDLVDLLRRYGARERSVSEGK